LTLNSGRRAGQTLPVTHGRFTLDGAEFPMLRAIRAGLAAANV
jgi:hypothetical protein